jgi:serine/threonine protein phosphatase 1
MFNFSPRRQRGPAGASGYRAYVVGDIHGRLDLLDQLLDKIHDQLRRRPARKTLLVFVGDLIDRGPQSAQVIERLRTYRRHGVRPIFILGNHEEVLLRIL